MLRNIHVKNIALIDDVEIELNNGMHVLSGETGAGKTTTALNLGVGLVRQGKRVLLVELTEEGRALEFKNHEDIDIFDTLNEEEKENLNEYLNRLTVALHNKFKEENPEKYEKIVKNRKEIFEKYFKEDDPNGEWLKMMKCNKK